LLADGVVVNFQYPQGRFLPYRQARECRYVVKARFNSDIIEDADLFQFIGLYAEFGWPLPLACAITIAGVAVLCVLVHALIIAPILGSVPINQLLAIGTGYRSSCRASPPTLLFGTKFRNLGLRLPKLVFKTSNHVLICVLVALLDIGNTHSASHPIQ
jgi:hypothetical protein